MTWEYGGMHTYIRTHFIWLKSEFKRQLKLKKETRGF